MSHLRVRYRAVLVVLMGTFVLVQVLQGQESNTSRTSKGEDGPANAQVSVSKNVSSSVVVSNGTLKNQGSSTVAASPLPLNLLDVLSYGYGIWEKPSSVLSYIPFPFPTNVPWKDTGTSIELFDYLLDPPSLACDYADCPRIVNPAGDVIDPGTPGAPTFCPTCSPYQEPGSGPTLLDVPNLSESISPADGVPNSHAGIAIDSRLEPDSPTDGITIETSLVASPSSGGIEMMGPTVPISIETNLLPNSTPAPAPSMADGVSAGGSHFDWAGFLNAALPVANAAISAYAGSHPAAAQVKSNSAKQKTPSQTCPETAYYAGRVLLWTCSNGVMQAAP